MAMRQWPARRWVVAATTALLTVLVVGVPTVLVPTPWFGREVAVTWWAWPVLVATAVLSGLLTATYVRADVPDSLAPAADDADDGTAAGRLGVAGSMLAYFAVGCPVCNKLALVALGYAGALQWFAPVQPVLALGAVALLAWALRRRLRGEVACPVQPSAPLPHPAVDTADP